MHYAKRFCPRLIPPRHRLPRHGFNLAVLQTDSPLSQRRDA